MIRNATRDLDIASDVTYCTTFLQRGFGLMFRRSLRENQAFVFTEHQESIYAATITMFFVFFPITVIWLNNDKCVVDKVLARPWRFIYMPNNPARYYIEAHPLVIDKVETDDVLAFPDPVS